MTTPQWRTDCPDWADRLRNGRSIIPPPIFPDEAEKALAVFRELKIVDAPGSPTFGDSCAPWVFEIVASVFGSYDANSGKRLIKEWFICLPKKNSKSTLSAGVMITALILNWRQSGQFTILAPTVEVATNSFSPARDMVKKDDDLNVLMNVQTHIKTISHLESNATLKVLAADSDTVGGIKSIGTLVDELYLFGKRANAEGMLREAIGGLASRPEGFVIYLTTQSDDPPAGVFLQKLQYARDVRDGIIIDPGFVPIIFEHPPEMVASKEHLKLENMALVNPNIGYSVSQEFLEREYIKAKNAGEVSFLGYMAKHGNVQIGMALRSDNWAGAPFWEKQGRAGISLQHILKRCEVVDVGIDGGGLDDLLGLSIVGRDSETREWLAWQHAWAHPSVLERRKSEASRFNDFAKDGDLTLVENMGDDVAEVASIVAEIDRAGLLDKIGVDPAGIGGVLDALTEEGVDQEKVVGISQGWKLSGSIKTAERKLAEGVLVHDGSKMMAWCVSNAKIEPKGNAMLITKQASGWAKIDPLMALFSAVALMSLNPESRGNADFSWA